MTPEQRARGERIKQRTKSMRDSGKLLIPLAADKPAIINDCAALLQRWKPGKFATGDVREHGGIPYKCVQAHDSTQNPGWTPDTVPALWMQYHGTCPETARQYIQPLGAHDAYQTDEYAIEGGVYRCKKDGTVFPPSTLPASWELVTDAAPEQPGEPDEPDEPEQPSEPEQPTVATWDSLPANHPFKVGDKFADGGKVYEVKRLFTKQENWRPPALTGDYYVIIG